MVPFGSLEMTFTMKLSGRPGVITRTTSKWQPLKCLPQRAQHQENKRTKKKKQNQRNLGNSFSNDEQSWIREIDMNKGRTRGMCSLKRKWLSSDMPEEQTDAHNKEQRGRKVYVRQHYLLGMKVFHPTRKLEPTKILYAFTLFIKRDWTDTGYLNGAWPKNRIAQKTEHGIPFRRTPR